MDCNGILTCESKQAGVPIFSRMISHTTTSISNTVGPVEQVELCGRPFVYIAPTTYVPEEVSPQNYMCAPELHFIIITWYIECH